ncbi:hypothetical protein [Streptomyces glaucescens]|uniref:Uncharacterized protein n=1 Tax=Streptomyces glaucescens TaxID=1907 RepID=A0A089X3Q4_STRGA|nr:hypothetical protein [Streptomyces glaucescens]AIR96416.1 hypothetical protein SGLAU_01940 [Streptomyces glaucescens]
MNPNAPSPADDREPAEHRRFAHCLRALETVSEADEAGLVAAVLDDRDALMAGSAVSRHLDRRAAALLGGPAFTAWARTLAGVVARSDFLTRRLREWVLLHSIVRGGPWTAGELAGASDWFQRTAVATPGLTDPAALALLARDGRTRRVRAAASRRLREAGRAR